MAMTIDTDMCMTCGSCAEVCPNGAISQSGRGQAYRIDPALCTECKGAAPEPQCASACPGGSISRLKS